MPFAKRIDGTLAAMEAIRVEPGAPAWDGLVRYLRDSGDARWTLAEDDTPLADMLYLTALEEDRIAGALVLREQVVMAPATEWSGGIDKPVERAPGVPLRETFVMSFSVAVAFRRRGLGRALQRAALELTREQGCCQMRSWSSLDKPANYALKLSLGFAMHPATHEAWNGMLVSGVYFVKRVD